MKCSHSQSSTYRIFNKRIDRETRNDNLDLLISIQQMTVFLVPDRYYLYIFHLYILYLYIFHLYILHLYSLHL